MRKLFIVLLAVFFASSGVVLAATPLKYDVYKVATRFWADDSKLLEPGLTQKIDSQVLAKESLGVVKFKDENTICYIAYNIYNGKAQTPTMQCLIK